ncbi:hypothetical protein PHAVU_011G185100 [Phaseolus vulgaris]|uniref:Uncharacterized protein n=1 Tax=Phaseolus vulgaris TaxID=3885 RepID=V7AIX1_PHAVU|nr:hypothetical protein PHAVU_011G185100g [Phaseolus vulgaris]ESW05504.1 hypothetical protein PHAVU_011G185100g [Phaseolus vulgaris]
MMMRQTKTMHYLGEVAPHIMKSHYKRRSTFSKLETIVEEERQWSNSKYKSVLISFPLLLSGFLYIYVCKEMV